MTVAVFLTHDLTCPTSGVTRLGTARVVDGAFAWEPAEVRWISPDVDPDGPGIPDHPVLRELVESVGNVLGLSFAENPAEPWPWLFSPHGSIWGRVESEFAPAPAVPTGPGLIACLAVDAVNAGVEAAPRRHVWRPRAARLDSLRDRMGAFTPEGLDWFLAGEECVACGFGRRGAEAAGIDACSGRFP